MPLHPIIDCPPHEMLALDLSVSNPELTDETFPTLADFEHWLTAKLASTGKRMAAGGYNEHRKWYQRYPDRFGEGENARCIHLGMDVWAPAGTPLYAPMDARIHSWANNAGTGNYGPTLVLELTHQGEPLYALFGHLAEADCANWNREGFKAGEVIAHLGAPRENGGWAPHVHVQLMRDMEGWKGDYVGVCTLNERARMLANCPDPGWMLGGGEEF